MTFPRPRDYPFVWILGALVLLALVIAFVACGSELAVASSPNPTPSPTSNQQSAACSCPATSCQCAATAPFTASVMGISPTAGWTAGTGPTYWRGPDGLVHLQGGVYWSSSAGLVVFTLPAGYRPSSVRYMGCVVRKDAAPYAPEHAVFSIVSDGTARVFGEFAEGDSVYFDGITFLAEE